MENYSLSDVAAVTGRNDGFFGGDGGFFWVFALLLLPGIFNGGTWGNNGRNAVDEATLSNAFNFNNLENTVGRISDTLQQNQMGMSRDLCTGLSAVNSAILENRFANKECCCETQQALLENRYLAAQNTAEINATTTAQTQKILDAICGNRIADMQNQINALQLQAATAGVVRYPNGFTYAASNPFLRLLMWKHLTNLLTSTIWSRLTGHKGV
jgi:hypothetical protein